MKLPGKVSPTNNPDVLSGRGFDHLGVDVRDAAFDKPNVGMFDGR